MGNSIEEAVKTMEHWIEYEKNNKDKINKADELINIQETILSDYKRVLKEKNRLEEQVEYDKTHIYTPQTIELNFISKSKIEDKIEKLNSESYTEKLEDMMNTKNYTITELVQYVLQELLDGSDTDVGSIGNSIEEALKKLSNGKKIKMYELLRTLKKEGIENFVITRKKYVDVILSDYKRILKENEILKEEKEQAWEEWNNLEQGSYGTEQKLKQQIKELKKENEELKFEERRRIIGKYGDAEIHDVINKILSNDYIPVQKVKDNIKKLEIKKEKARGERNILERFAIEKSINSLQELLESEE